MFRDRKQLRRRAAIAVVLLALFAAGVLWWMYPSAALPPLLAVAFDGICLPVTEVQVRLQLEPIDAETPMPNNLAQLSATFIDPANPAPSLARTFTDRTGLAQAAVQFAQPATEVRFQGRFDGTRHLKPSMDQARIFFVPQDTGIVVVDVNDLFDDPALNLTSKDVNQVLHHQPTAKRLRAWKDEKKQIVYLAVQSDRARGYDKCRRWLALQGPKLPPGPVLARPAYHDGKSAEQAQRQVITELTRCWKKVIAAGRHQASADFYRQEGISYLDIGQ
jgi:hypothetical protein